MPRTDCLCSWRTSWPDPAGARLFWQSACQICSIQSTIGCGQCILQTARRGGSDGPWAERAGGAGCSVEQGAGARDRTAVGRGGGSRGDLCARQGGARVHSGRDLGAGRRGACRARRPRWSRCRAGVGRRRSRSFRPAGHPDRERRRAAARRVPVLGRAGVGSGDPVDADEHRAPLLRGDPGAPAIRTRQYPCFHLSQRQAAAARSGALEQFAPGRDRPGQIAVR